MEALCPDCNNELTPSIVGYLCHNCGSMHQFDKVSKKLTSSKAAKSEPTETSNRSNQKSSQHVASRKNNSSSKLRDFIVPRISSKNATSLNSKE